MPKRILFFSCAVLITVMPAAAAIIFDNGAPVSDLPGWLSDFSSGELTADDFSLEWGAAVIRDIHWWGAYFEGSGVYDDDFTIWIFADDSGPDVPPLHALTGLSVTRELTGQDNSLGDDIYFYSLALDTPIALDANTTYWLAIINSSPGDDFWVWANSNAVGNSLGSLDNGQTWGLPGREVAFYLTNDVVPEPASLTLLGLGLAGLTLRIRARKQ